jgi:hypothetical protein
VCLCPYKRAKRGRRGDSFHKMTNAGHHGASQGKRCAHCNTHTTPLWRNGPDGPKTLCNACGVRDNRRQNKTRNVLQKPRVKKIPKSPPTIDSVLVDKKNNNSNSNNTTNNNNNNNGTKSTHAIKETTTTTNNKNNNNITNNIINATSRNKNRKKVKEQNARALHPGFSKDPFAKTDDIHVPEFGEAETGEYYAAMNDGRAYRPPQGYHKSDDGVVAARFGPNTAAATYECDDQDLQWLESQRDAFVAAENTNEKVKKNNTTTKTTTTNTNTTNNKTKTNVNNIKSGGVMKDAANGAVTQEHVEKLFDVFEEASWCNSSMISSNSACDIVLGRCYSPSTEEDALHWTSDQPMHEACLVSPPHYNKRNDKRQSLPNKYDTWGAVMNGGENSNEATNDFVALPPTPCNDANAMKNTRTNTKSKLNKSIINSGSENSSECSEEEHLARLEKLSDVNDSSDGENLSGNGHSNDLVVKRVTRSLYSINKNSKSLTKVHLEGRAASSKQSAAALKLRKARRAAEWVPLTLEVGAGELKTPIQQKTKKNKKNSTKLNIINNNNRINIKNSSAAYNVAFGGAKLTKRVTRGNSKSSLLENKVEVFDPALLERKMNLTVKTVKKKPSSVVIPNNNNTKINKVISDDVYRQKALVVKPDAAMEKAFAELRKKYPHAPSRSVVLRVHHYWFQKRMLRNAGRPLLARFFWTPSKELRERPELATDAERDRYLFCFDAAAVKRQMAEKEERKNALQNSGGALAQKRRRRRACFNPAASKRRRKAQAEMDFAATQPLTICFEPLEDVLEYGLEYIEADDERYHELMASAEGVAGTPMSSNVNKRETRRMAAAKKDYEVEKNTIVGSFMKKVFGGWRDNRDPMRPGTPKKRRSLQRRTPRARM